MDRNSDGVKKARHILGGADAGPAEVLELVNAQLKRQHAFGLAHKLLDRYAKDPRVGKDSKLKIQMAQQGALCTYKDPDLPTDERLDRALQILREHADLDQSRDRETLGLAGAIFKRRWELTTQQRDLEASLAWYERAYTQGETEDFGWTGLNTAFVLDVLAHQESIFQVASPQNASLSEVRRARAQEIRRELIAGLPALLQTHAFLQKKWWFHATLAEAHFGLEQFAEASKWLDSGKTNADPADWEKEATARQLASLLLLKRKAGSENLQQAEGVLHRFLGSDAAVESVQCGKIGLALSGGGFRASLYHIGVLARLAELDLLRKIEFLSCVSGGSIIGAHYYLEVRELLRTKSDAEIEQQDYIDIVARIEKDFLAGVQTNIRTSILSEWKSSLKMIFVPDYSRTKRAGDLYEAMIYSRVEDGENRQERWLNKLKVVPKGEPEDFSPKGANWRRRNKVPILILNATALNTGHNWQFTATWMGEPPGTIDTKIDANYRFRRLYYDDAPNGNSGIRLGHAVAASSCVPGIFEPLSLRRIYERTTDQGKVEPIVRLVDGGVQDNQGVGALLDQGVTVMLVSDASGQMNANDFPDTGMLSVPLRANSILQARIRESQYRELSARRRSGLLNGLMFSHLKQDLESQPLDWIDSKDRWQSKRVEHLLTTYGVNRDIQRCLAGVRTDLDSFSDTEAYALMCDGYMMTEYALRRDEQPLGFQIPTEQSAPWDFLCIKDLMSEGSENNSLLRQLRQGHRQFFKIWSLSSSLKLFGVGLGITILLFLFAIAYLAWDVQLFSLSVGNLVLVGVVVGLLSLGFSWLSMALNYRKTMDQVLIGIGLAFLGAFLAKLHLCVFDRWFLRQGAMERLVPPPAEDGKRPTSAATG